MAATGAADAAGSSGAQVWTPAQEGVSEICALLHEYLLPGVDQARIFRHLQQCSSYPDFNNYLTFILTRAESQPVEVRQSAGLLLKNNLKTQYASLNPVFQQYIKGEVLPFIGSGDRHLRATVGTVVSVIVQQGKPSGWPEIWAAFGQCLESNDFNHMEGALDALFKIAEDDPKALEQEVPGLPDLPVNIFLPRLIQLFPNTQTVLRRLALATVNQYILEMPRVLMLHMDSYLQGLFALASDTAGEVRKLVCAALVTLLEVAFDYLQPHMRNVVEYMLLATQDSDEEVALEACEFWSAFCEAHLPVELLREFVPRLVAVLLTNMMYADDDEAVLGLEEDEGSAPDRDEDIKPFFHQARLQGMADGENEGNEDEDDIVNVWNLRKCSAAGLDVLSTVFREELLPILMPLVQAKLANTSEEGWKEREAAVLAMGAVAEGCIAGLLPHLSQITALLVPLLEDKQPLVRSIACWTLSRYSKWTVQAAQTPEGQEQLETVMMGLLRRILDTNKRVQEAACSSFATLEEEAAEELSPRLEPILQHLMFAFQKYHRKNLRILYDAIGTLADAVGQDLNQEQYLSILMPPLIAKWQQLPDSDKDLFPLLECLTSIAQALGPGFAQYAEPVFNRCTSLIRQQLAAQANPQVKELYDKEFIVCSLDLLSGLAEGLGAGVESLVGQSDLTSLLLQCCADSAADVRQSAFALVGDLAKCCIVHIKPRLPELLQLATTQLGPDVLTQDNISVANNACWAIGELSVKLQQEMAPVVLPVVQCLVPILTSEGARVPNRSLLENSAITLGRLGWVSPDQVAPHMEHFMMPWCRQLRSIRDDVEKEHAFMGLCAMVKVNPAGALSAFVPMCQAIGSWHDIRSDELQTELGHVLHGYKQLLGQGSWEQYMSALEPVLKEKLSKKYNV